MPQQAPVALANRLIAAGENKARQGQTLAREAQMMADAARTIAELLEENARLRDKFAHAQYKRTPKSRRPQNTILIDGSGSMAGKVYLSNAIDSALRIKECEDKTHAFLFGGDSTTSIALDDPSAVNTARKGLWSNSDLGPSLEALRSDLRTGKHRLIIMNDGQIDDAKRSEELLFALLNNNPNLVLEIIAPAYSTSIRQPSSAALIAESLQASCPKRVVFTPAEKGQFNSAMALKPLPPARKQSPKI